MVATVYIKLFQEAMGLAMDSKIHLKFFDFQGLIRS